MPSGRKHGRSVRMSPTQLLSATETAAREPYRTFLRVLHLADGRISAETLAEAALVDVEAKPDARGGTPHLLVRGVRVDAPGFQLLLEYLERYLSSSPGGGNPPWLFPLPSNPDMHLSVAYAGECWKRARRIAPSGVTRKMPPGHEVSDGAR